MPVHNLAQLFLSDALQNKAERDEFLLITKEDIKEAFDHVTQLQYNQQLPLDGKGKGIVITPHRAGHMLGSAVWHIEKETEEVVYAVDYDHRKEQHLNGTTLESFMKPSLLITDAADVSTNVKRKDRDDQLISLISDTFKAGGRVLMPVDGNGRVLELLLLLEKIWTNNPELTPHPVIFVGSTSSTLLQIARSNLEWMGDAVNKEFERTRLNPFTLSHVTVYANLQELQAHVPSLYSDACPPMVVLASSMDMQYGPAYDLFIRWSIIPNV